MIKELYCKLPTDVNYELKLESSDEITNILQQIKVILGTMPYEVLGSPNFGLDLKKFLFLMNYNEDEIRYEILYAISQHLYYNRLKYDVGISLNFGKDHITHDDYAVVDIAINEQKYMGILVTQ